MFISCVAPLSLAQLPPRPGAVRAPCIGRLASITRAAVLSQPDVEAALRNLALLIDDDDDEADDPAGAGVGAVEDESGDDVIDLSQLP